MKLFPKFRPLALISFFGIACLTVSFGQTTEVVFFETFGSTSPSGNNIGLYSQYGDNRGNVEASSYRIWFGDTVTNLGTGIQNPFFGFYSSDSSWDGIDGASGGNLLRFSEFSSTSSTTTQWYQFNAIPLTGHVGDSLAIEFLFRGLSPGAFPDVSDYFTLSISWDSVTFTEVELSFFNGIREGSGASDAWKSVVGTAQTIEGESVWLRITANPTAAGAFPEMFFDDLKLTVSAAAVPEPATYVAIFGGLALTGVLVIRRRRMAAG